MSGLYNSVMGQHPLAPALVGVLQGYEPRTRFGRFRDAWPERDPENPEKILIRVHTRNGGSNRQDHQAEILSMRAHPWYHHDADMDWDNTYADFYFEVKDEDLTHMLGHIATDPVDVPARWREAIDKLTSERPE